MSWTAPRTWTDPEVPDAAMMNAHIRDNLNVIGQHQYVRKASSTTRSSTTTLANDPDLLLPLGTSQTWEWQARILFTSGATPGFKFTFAVPAGSTGSYFTPGNGVVENSGGLFGTSNGTYGTARSNTGTTYADSGMCWGIVTTSSTAGNIAFQWSQAVSDGSSTIVYVNSWMLARRIS